MLYTLQLIVRLRTRLLIETYKFKRCSSQFCLYSRTHPVVKEIHVLKLNIFIWISFQKAYTGSNCLFSSSPVISCSFSTHNFKNQCSKNFDFCIKIDSFRNIECNDNKLIIQKVFFSILLGLVQIFKFSEPVFPKFEFFASNLIHFDSIILRRLYPTV